MFSDLHAEENPTEYTYFYNPCLDFKLGASGDCSKGVSVCQKKATEEAYFSLGKQDKSEFIWNGNNLSISYKSIDTSGIIRTTNVTLVCSKNGSTFLEVLGEPTPLHYVMNLYSECACANGCVEAAPLHEDLSPGSVLVILFFVFVTFYLLGGVIYRKIVMGATGYEVIPNLEFWVDFPLLVRDGCVFCTRGCQGSSYDRI